MNGVSQTRRRQTADTLWFCWRQRCVHRGSRGLVAMLSFTSSGLEHFSAARSTRLVTDDMSYYWLVLFILTTFMWLVIPQSCCSDTGPLVPTRSLGEWVTSIDGKSSCSVYLAMVVAWRSGNALVSFNIVAVMSRLVGSSMTMTLHSSTRPLLQAPRTRMAYGGRAFSSAVLAIWNNLSTSVIEASSLPVFRRWLKTHLFTVAFEASG